MNRDYDAGYHDGMTHLAVATVESLRYLADRTDAEFGVGAGKFIREFAMN